MSIYKSLRRPYLEALGNQSASLSLSNISKFYLNYINDNYDKAVSELDRVGYFTLKNKLSIGNNSTTTKDVFITAYFCNIDMLSRCNSVIAQKYHTDVNIRSTNGFFVPSTTELVIIVIIDLDEPIEYSITKSDIRSTVEHELVHAFDSTNKSDVLSKQNPMPGIGDNFISACAYIGCLNRHDITSILSEDIFSDGTISDCLYSISIVLYRLFTISEFNAHQVSDLEETHNVDIRRSDELKKALKRDVLNDFNLTDRHLKNAVLYDADECPELWRIVGKVLAYLGYKINKNSPSAVYKFFKQTSEKLFKKFLNKKTKNQIKAAVSLKEKNLIKDRLIDCIYNDNFKRGISFWFSPSGDSNSYLCRVYEKLGKVTLTINHDLAIIYGNADGMLYRALDALNNSNNTKFKFAIGNLVDVIVQSIERNFNNVGYNPLYDITEPQDETQISKSNKVNRFADLDWD